MKLASSFHGLPLCLAGLTVFASGQSALERLPPDRHPTNLLGNGGMESWGLGVNERIPPESWWVMGSPLNNFNDQVFLIIRRVPGMPDCELRNGGGLYAVELTALQPGNFLSQRIEDFLELRCKVITFSVSFRTDYAVTSPRVIVDDGIATSSECCQLVDHEWVRLTVQHKVSEDATKLEVKIDPDTIAIVDNAQVSVGSWPDACFAPRPNLDAGAMQLPLGSIISWYRPDPRMPVPEGFALADGNEITDAESPFLGLPTPNLSDRFVLGVTSTGRIGETGGNPTVDLRHRHTGRTKSAGTAETWLIPQNVPPPWLLACNENHDHAFTSDYALGNVDIRPPYYGLLQIMRIK